MANKTRDQRLIEENPNASPKELLALGLSEKGFEELTAKETKPAEPTPQTGPVQPTVVQGQKTAVPRMQEYIPPRDSADMVTLVGPDGKRTRMTRYAATRYMRGGRNTKFKLEA